MIAPMDTLTPPAVRTEGSPLNEAVRQFQGIPGIDRTPDGTLWATWYGGGNDEGPDNYVLLARSDDDGATWSRPILAIDPPGKVRAFDPCLWTDPAGRLWLFWAQSFEKWDGRGGVWAMTHDGLRWSSPRRLCDGVMMNKPTVARDGRWLLPVAMWQCSPLHPAATLAAGATVFVSSDDGASFSLLGIADVDSDVAEFEEHMIVERQDRSLWMLLRTKRGIAESISSNGGRTWSPAAPSAIPHVNARFFIRRLASGRLLLVKHSPPDAPPRRSHLTAHLSEDDGLTWSEGLLIDERMKVSYPDAIEQPDGRVRVIYDFDRYGQKQIWLATFAEADVPSGAAPARVLVNQAP